MLDIMTRQFFFLRKRMEQSSENKQQEADAISSATINPLSFFCYETPSLVPRILILVIPDCTNFS